jgi:hypothetical protein
LRIVIPGFRRVDANVFFIHAAMSLSSGDTPPQQVSVKGDNNRRTAAGNYMDVGIASQIMT